MVEQAGDLTQVKMSARFQLLRDDFIYEEGL
jgi:hypothetical protein